MTLTPAPTNHFAQQSVEQFADYDLITLDEDTLLARLAARAAKHGEPIVLLQENAPIAVLLSFAALTALIEEVRSLRALYALASAARDHQHA